jgi:CDP-glycerol glycerophosphotransferase
MMRARIRSDLRERFSGVRLRLTKGSARVALTYARYRSRLPIANKTVLFESYHGARMSCVPYALFKAMLADDDFRDFRFVWTFNPHDDGSNLIHSRYTRHPRVEFCRRHSNAYLKHLATAKYLVNNKTFHHYFAKRPEQVHLSSWHATAFKTLGKDQYGSMGQYGNVTRNYLQTDYLVMPNRFTADVLLDSCDVRSVFPGLVVDAGYPRSDLTVGTDPAEMRALLVELLDIEPDKKIVLYAPTWRGEVGAAVDTSDVIAESITALSLGLPEGYQLLLKVHDRAYQFAKANPALSGLANVPDWVETNELLSAVDVLITDYSSICFDFLCLRRPIIHFVFDRQEYERTRGLYFDMETEMAGPLCYTAEEVNAAIARIDEIAEEYGPRHGRLIERLASHEDGDASRRVLDIVFRGRNLEYAYRVEDTSKTRVLAYAGTLDASKAHILDSLSGLDFSAIDLALLFDGAPTKVDEYYLTKLNPAIKVFYRAATPLRSFIDASLTAAAGSQGRSRYLSPDHAMRWREELLGHIRFDVAVDFCGTASVWQLIFAHTPFAKRVVFLPDVYASSGACLSLDFLRQHFDVLACSTLE